MPAKVWTILDDAIARMTRRIVTRHVIQRLLFCLALLLAALLALVIADHALKGGLPDAWTWPATLLALAAALVAAVVLIAFALFRRWNPVLAAWHIENFIGGTHNSVINAVLLRRDEPEIAAGDAVARRAVGDVREAAAYARPTPTRRDRRPLFALLVAAAAWLVFAIVTPKSVSQSLARLVGARMPAPTMTQLAWLGADPVDSLYAGQPLDVRVAVRGRVVPRVECAWTPLSGAAAVAPSLRTLVRAAGADEIWSTHFVGHETSSDFRIAISAGDALIQRDIHVRPYPDVLGLKFTITPPAYTRLPAETVVESDIAAPEGAELALEVTGNVEIRNPVLIFDDERHASTRMVVRVDDPRRAGLTFRAEHDARYHVDFADAWGMTRRQPPLHSIRVLADQPPRIVITTPAPADRPRDGVDLNTLAAIEADATDDYGVRDIVFVLSGDGIGETRIPIPSVESAPPKHARAEIPVARIPLAAGRSAQAWFEVRDNRVAPDGAASPQLSRSETLNIRRPAAVDPARQDQPPQSMLARSAGSSGDPNSEKQPDESESAGRKASSARESKNNAGSKGRPSASAAQGSDSSSQSGNTPQQFMKENEQKLRDIARKLAQQDENRPSESADGKREDASERGGGDKSDSSQDAPDGQSRPNDKPGTGRSANSQTPSESKSPQGQADKQPGQPQGSTPDSGGQSAAQKGGASKSGQNEKRDQGSQPHEKPATNAEHRNDPNQGKSPSDDSTDKGIPAGGNGAQNRKSDKAAGDSEKGDEKSGGGDKQQRSGADEKETPPSPQQEGGSGSKQRGKSGDGNSDGGPSKAPDKSENPPQNSKETPPSKPKEQQKSAEKSAGGKDSNASGQGQGANQSGSSGQDGQSNQAGSNSGNSPSDGESQSGSNPRDGGGKGRSGTGDGQDGGKGDAAQSGSGASQSPNKAGSNQSGSSPGGGLDENSAAAEKGGGQSKGAAPTSKPSKAPEPGSEDQPGPDPMKFDTEGHPELSDTLERLLRSGGVTPELARELGWTAEQASSFNRALEKLRDKGERGESVDPNRERIHTQVGSDNAQQARARSADARYRTSGTHADDRLRQITPPAEQKISPELRAVLDAYYRTMSSRETGNQSSEKPPK